MNVRHLIQQAIDHRKDELERLEKMMELASQLDSEGWAPKVYAEIVRSLRKVGMVVVHQSLIFDIKRMAEELDDSLPDRRMDDEDDRFTKRDLDRIIRKLDDAYGGIPDKSLS